MNNIAANSPPSPRVGDLYRFKNSASGTNYRIRIEDLLIISGNRYVAYLDSAASFDDAPHVLLEEAFAKVFEKAPVVTHGNISLQGLPSLLNGVYAEIQTEREYQKSLGTADLDKHNTPSDWVACIVAYAGAGINTFSQTKPDFRKAMLKVAAIAVAAVESADRANG